jgi:uncharacterized membrane protein YqjE
MSESESAQPGGFGRLQDLARHATAALDNRAELFSVEFQEERARLIESFLWAAGACLFGLLFLVVLTTSVILMVPAEDRVYAAGAFAGVYLVAAVLAVLNLRALWRSTSPPFAHSIDELRKDLEWFDSLK